MHEEKPTGKLDPKQEAALEHQFEQADSSYMPSIVRHEDDGSKTDMTLLTVEAVSKMQSEINRLRAELCDTKTKLIAHEQDVRDAAGEFRIPVPAPRTETAGLLASAVLSRRRAQRYEEENLVLLREVDEWKNASQLEIAGDPDGILPRHLAAYIAEQDALCTMLANARHEAARLGYCAGHNDTVEGTYADPSEVAADICQEMDDDERMGENA